MGQRLTDTKSAKIQFHSLVNRYSAAAGGHYVVGYRPVSNSQKVLTRCSCIVGRNLEHCHLHIWHPVNGLFVRCLIVWRHLACVSNLLIDVQAAALSKAQALLQSTEAKFAGISSLLAFPCLRRKWGDIENLQIIPYGVCPRSCRGQALVLPHLRSFTL